MKKLAITLITIISLCSTNFSYGADRYVTLTNIEDGSTRPSSSVNIAANEVAWILFVSKNGDGSSLRLAIDGGTDVYIPMGSTPSHGISPNLPIAGPATITYKTTVTVGGANAVNFTTIKISPNPNIGGVGQ